MRIGYDLPGDHDDPQVKEFMDKSHNWAQSFEGDLVGPFDHPSGTAADEPFEVAHSLGEIPGSFAIEDLGFTGSGVYATAEDRDKWTATSIIIRSSNEANANISVRVRRRFDA
jgi:hypothetical protein